MPEGTMNEGAALVPATRRATISPRVAVVPSPLVKAAEETSSGEHADWDMLRCADHSAPRSRRVGVVASWGCALRRVRARRKAPPPCGFRCARSGEAAPSVSDEGVSPPRRRHGR